VKSMTEEAAEKIKWIKRRHEAAAET